jgi:hypothetical protein
MIILLTKGKNYYIIYIYKVKEKRNMARTIFINIDECVWVNYNAEYTEKKYNWLKEYYKQYNQSIYNVLASISFDDVVDIFNGDKEDIVFNYTTTYGSVYTDSVANIVKEDMRDEAYDDGVTRYGDDVLDRIENIDVVFEEEDDD